MLLKDGLILIVKNEKLKSNSTAPKSKTNEACIAKKGCKINETIHKRTESQYNTIFESNNNKLGTKND